MSAALKRRAEGGGVDQEQLERLRRQYMEIVEEMDKDSSRAAYHFGRLEIVTKLLFRLVDRDS